MILLKNQSQEISCIDCDYELEITLCCLKLHESEHKYRKRYERSASYKTNRSEIAECSPLTFHLQLIDAFRTKIDVSEILKKNIILDQ